MTRTPFTIFFVLTLLMTSASQVHAQRSSASLERTYKNSGQSPYIVKKGSLSDFTGRKDKIVADFDTLPAAQEAEKKLNDALKGNDAYAWIYMARKRSDEVGSNSDGNEIQPGSVIKLPKLNTVDPGGSARGDAPSTDALVKSFKGKSGQGKIAKVEVTVEFLEDGTVKFGGKVSETGKLTIVDGQLVIETDVARYSLRTDGDMVFGVRTAKGNSAAKSPWSVRLTNSSERTEKPMKGDAYNEPRTDDKPWLVGDWERSSPDKGDGNGGWKYTLLVKPDGTASKKSVWSAPKNKDAISVDKYRWKSIGDSFELEHVGEIFPNGNEVGGDRRRNWKITHDEFDKQSNGWKRLK